VQCLDKVGDEGSLVVIRLNFKKRHHIRVQATEHGEEVGEEKRLGNYHYAVWIWASVVQLGTGSGHQSHESSTLADTE
jgi:hypothetical protein